MRRIYCASSNVKEALLYSLSEIVCAVRTVPHREERSVELNGIFASDVLACSPPLLPFPNYNRQQMTAKKVIVHNSCFCLLIGPVEILIKNNNN